MVTDWYAFTLSSKGVVLEGLEVVFIALTFGANQHNVPLAALAALAAAVLVAAVGIAVRAPLARIPENTMKFVVGVMLTSFGIFWGRGGGRGTMARRRRRVGSRGTGGGAVRAAAGRGIAQDR
jgi:uncharacterized membrane protein